MKRLVILQVILAMLCALYIAYAADQRGDFVRIERVK